MTYSGKDQSRQSEHAHAGNARDRNCVGMAPEFTYIRSN